MPYHIPSLHPCHKRQDPRPRTSHSFFQTFPGPPHGLLHEVDLCTILCLGCWGTEAMCSEQGWKLRCKPSMCRWRMILQEPPHGVNNYVYFIYTYINYTYVYMCVCIYNYIILYHHYMIMWSLSLSPSPSPWFINVYHYLAWEAVSILQPEKRLRATCQVFGSGTASQQFDASLTVGKWPEPAIGIGIILCKPPDYTKWQTSWILMALKYFITYPGRSVDDRVWTPGVSQPCTPWVRENACGKLLRQTSICRLLLDAMWIFLWISIWDNLSAYIHILGSTHISIYVYKYYK